jgi:porin
MNRFAAIVVFIWFQLAAFAVSARAGESPSTTPYSGDLWTRSTLTGDWGGLRNRWPRKGVTLDLSVTQIGQGVVGGGKSGAWQYGGRGDIILNLDSQKLGLWPGAFLNLEAEGNWASAVNANTGALMPVNSSQTVPLPGENFDLVSLNFYPILFALFRIDYR